MTALLTQTALLATPIEEGDAGVVIKADGSFKIFSAADLAACDPETITDAQVLQARKVKALCLALSSDQVMEQLMDAVDRIEEAGGEIVAVGQSH
ncbi:hypothetical protein [Azospirillum argentinense]|uniref:hypothetical protein n=1 Tax=Azospirillum argentinense TaxID=2970906 RepID=UPI0032DE3646